MKNREKWMQQIERNMAAGLITNLDQLYAILVDEYVYRADRGEGVKNLEADAAEAREAAECLWALLIPALDNDPRQ